MIFYFHKYNKESFPDTYILFNEISEECRILSWAEYLNLCFEQLPVASSSGRLTEITLVPRDFNQEGGYIHFDLDILLAQDRLLYDRTIQILNDMKKRDYPTKWIEISTWIRKLIDWKNSYYES